MVGPLAMPCCNSETATPDPSPVLLGKACPVHAVALANCKKLAQGESGIRKPVSPWIYPERRKMT